MTNHYSLNLLASNHSVAKQPASESTGDNVQYQQLYDMLLNATPSSILLIDSKLRITSANRNFLTRSQRTLSATIGCRLTEVFPMVILERTDIKQQILEVFNTHKASVGRRMTYRAPGVPFKTYYYRILPVESSEQCEQVMLLMEDVTDQIRLSEDMRRMESHLGSIVESASDLMLSLDTEGRILTWNLAAEKLSGFTFLNVKGKLFFEFFKASEHLEIKTLFINICIHVYSLNAELELISGEGTEIPVAWVFSPMKDDDAKTVGIVAVGRDLTEQRKLEVELRQSQKLAALGVMAGGIAHEIRNPLAVCSSAAQFLMEEGLPLEFRTECAEKIQVSLEKASCIIENLLRFSRPSSEQNMVPVDLDTVLCETIMLIANQAKVYKIEIVYQPIGKCGSVSGIFTLLQQVFMNFFLNAINAMPHGGKLSIILEQQNDEARICIRDTGTGILEGALDNIFDPFHTSSPAGKGVGLGLSLCYSIVKQHRGSISVDSMLGKGSTFTVLLPAL
ncbi:PAS/PAC sensor signal transduction histidine kinase [Psychromonas ingrahamii 37]|uniref:histidine kinase n=1 Tax=Psychromonas ingrahamii (strain DSM 17664 / CCUG 51855 / 37) TaxID=357804 RepID=A1SUB5_PSYIN|nr:ATP-binding protein [Psychromonas ingrahamii]ABM03080.1 PAS/PAC sensor signal transduction histidine kinase [Psychromonas ingrahamii 37]